MATATLMLRGLTPRLKGKIAKRIETGKGGANMNDVLVGILANAYRIPFEPSGVRRLSIGPSEQTLLSMPEELKQAISDEAHETRESMTNIALEIICSEFRVAFTPTGRWPRTRKAAAA